MWAAFGSRAWAPAAAARPPRPPRPPAAGPCPPRGRGGRRPGSGAAPRPGAGDRRARRRPAAAGLAPARVGTSPRQPTPMPAPAASTAAAALAVRPPPQRGAQLAQLQPQLVEAQVHLPRGAARAQQLPGHASRDRRPQAMEQRAQVLALHLGRDAGEAGPARHLDLEPPPAVAGLGRPGRAQRRRARRIDAQQPIDQGVGQGQDGRARAASPLVGPLGAPAASRCAASACTSALVANSRSSRTLPGQSCSRQPGQRRPAEEHGEGVARAPRAPTGRPKTHRAGLLAEVRRAWGSGPGTAAPAAAAPAQRSASSRQKRTSSGMSASRSRSGGTRSRVAGLSRM